MFRVGGLFRKSCPRQCSLFLIWSPPLPFFWVHWKISLFKYSTSYQQTLRAPHMVVFMGWGLRL